MYPGTEPRERAYRRMPEGWKPRPQSARKRARIQAAFAAQARERAAEAEKDGRVKLARRLRTEAAEHDRKATQYSQLADMRADQRAVLGAGSEESDA